MARSLESSDRAGIIEKLVPILVVFAIGLSFLVGVLWQRVTSLEKGGKQVAAGTTDNTQAQAAPQETVDINTVKGIWDKDVVKFGDASRKVLFVEVADPSCPYCHVASGENGELASKMGSQFKYVSDGGTYEPPVTEMRKLVESGQAAFAYIYFPGHGSGEMAMKSMYCAAEKGKFWEVHDLLMTQAGYDLQNDTVKNDKAQSGKMADFLKGVIDADFIKGCLESGTYDQRLTGDQSLASSLSVQGTPGFFVNENRFNGAYSWADMKSVVEAALK